MRVDRTLGRLTRSVALFARASLATAFLTSASLGSPAGAAQDATSALAAAFNGFGQDVFAVLERKPGNIVFSPYSVGVAMAMTMSGAGGDTQSEMLKAMRFTQTPSAIEATNGELAALLKSYGRAPPAEASPEEQCRKINMPAADCVKRLRAALKPPAAPTELEIANALMITPKGDDAKIVSPQYASLLQKAYAAAIFQEASLQSVNQWAAGATRDKIDPFLRRIDPDAIAVILDAVYFKGTWETPFDAASTKDGPFTLASGATIQIPTMSTTKPFALLAGAGFKAVRLPYQTPDLGMIIVLPDDAKRLDAVSAKLDAAGLAKLVPEVEAATSALLELKLPRFKAEFGANLKEPMQLAGLKLAFDPQNANFDGIAGRPLGPGTIYVSSVIHKATIEVTEEGTVAAAVTAVTITLKAAPMQPPLFAVDRPFLFYITDRKSGAILFQGRIEDPRQRVNDSIND
ncbi:serpin B [Rhizobiales bacterium GAS191]|nr:serpin B [Rhizobiales bacterium GAS191]